ncbi:hypothetical protein [Clostridium frigidicarnis]|uniref:Uncharacterized protein n=1 Tax=Clostridium frigidicarnis TaxID=84698 RepID=A0A1I0VG93_9CLOT|nr:hypothetical protein [Clostridium frigidicarnis]SFA75043.1 hypothetical protein SAMN04488528_100237 [Clostridium frigidicarnis]
MDRKVLFGIGIGIIIGTLFMISYKFSMTLNQEEIENKARNLGMDYPSEFKVINKDKKEVNGND